MNNDIYLEEAERLKKFKNFESKNNSTIEEYKIEYSKLVNGFEELLSQVKVITRIGDRLQKRLNRQNEELQTTIEELVRVKISRKATTIVFVIAIAIFLILEAFIEPIIESHTDFYYGLIFKLIIVLSIKPLEMTIEHKLLNKAKSKDKLSS